MSDITSGDRISFWIRDVAPLQTRPLGAEKLTADVVVVGGGLAGVSVAYSLQLEGRSVILLEDGCIGSGETGRTTAHLMSALDDRYYNIKKLFGEDGAKLAAESHKAAIDIIEANVRREGIHCNFTRLKAYLFEPNFSMGSSQKGVEELVTESEAAFQAGISNRLVDRAPIKDYDTGRCIEFDDQGEFHPMRYLLGLTDAFIRRGGKVFTHTHAVEMKGGKQAYVTTSDGGRIDCADIVVATNTPVNDRVTMHTKQEGYRSYVICTRVPKGYVTKALFWDTEDPYHYARTTPLNESEDLLIIGGEDHRTGQNKDYTLPYQRLYDWGKQRWPMMSRTIEYQWSGQVWEPVDLLGFIGHNPHDASNVYIVTGDSGTGMTHCTIAGKLITDQIQGRTNPWEKLYDPSRLKVRGMKDYLEGNLNTGAQYLRFFSGSDQVNDIEEIPKDCGAIIRNGIHFCAVYKDEKGQVHSRSAVCPHLKGLIQWNPDEKSWDCPAHGSRFDRFGKVMEGPANEDLHPPGFQVTSR